MQTDQLFLGLSILLIVASKYHIQKYFGYDLEKYWLAVIAQECSKIIAAAATIFLGWCV